MPRTFAVSFNAVAITAAQDLFEISPADDKPVRLLGLVVGQYSDVGDANSENLSLSIIRGYTSSGSGGSAFTALPLDPNDSAAGFSAEINNTTVANTGTAVTLWSDVWNTQAGYQVWFPDGAQPQASQANTTIVVRITAPADSITTNATLMVQEL